METNAAISRSKPEPRPGTGQRDRNRGGATPPIVPRNPRPRSQAELAWASWPIRPSINPGSRRESSRTQVDRENPNGGAVYRPSPPTRRQALPWTPRNASPATGSTLSVSDTHAKLDNLRRLRNLGVNWRYAQHAVLAGKTQSRRCGGRPGWAEDAGGRSAALKSRRDWARGGWRRASASAQQTCHTKWPVAKKKRRPEGISGRRWR